MSEVVTLIPSEMIEERDRGMESPPVDDICPICREDNFSVPCRTSCGHWYCAACILKCWDFGDLQPCKCPMCCQRINRLTPEKSLHLRQEEEVTKVLKNVRKYNQLFVGDTRGLILKVCDLQLFVERMLRDMMDTVRDDGYLYKACLLALLLSILYKINIFEAIPLGLVWITRMFDYYVPPAVVAAVLVITILLLGIYRICGLSHRVKRRARIVAARYHA
ncbi:hypothetical protein F0562_020291 [Nyssa sinensis]|uniref:RING-type domain-containing protein n=1 Tax=Nyssa sinensis TaxID=561372 RepID=A0A5J5BUR3_9ASTE|nr:hypothetical protein F0562_020291 [Nyssa sinensis]